MTLFQQARLNLIYLNKVSMCLRVLTSVSTEEFKTGARSTCLDRLTICENQPRQSNAGNKLLKLDTCGKKLAENKKCNVFLHTKILNTNIVLFFKTTGPIHKRFFAI